MQRNLVLPTEFVEARDVEELPGGAVRFCRVEFECPLVPAGQGAAYRATHEPFMPGDEYFELRVIHVTPEINSIYL